MTIGPIRFGPQVCGDLSQGAAREWLLTDGLGGYAMGTVSGLRTRRYHGLLVVAGAVPARRHLALAALDATVTLPTGAKIRLAVHEWTSGAVEPQGHQMLAEFDLADGVPRWRWQVGATVIEREIAMRHGEPCVAIVHRLVSGGPVELTLDALCTWRDAHGERTAAGPPPKTTETADGFVVEDAYRLRGPGWQTTGEWWHGVRHREEAARGLTAVEDLWHAGRFEGVLENVMGVTAWAGDLAAAPPPGERIVTTARDRGRSFTDLARAADQFVVRTPAGPDVVAGYPWFGAWGRDTMTAYEGLFLATGRFDEGRELLLTYASTLSEGMLANTCDTGAPEHNTVDATLWFLHAVDRHVAAAGDEDLAQALRGDLRSVVDHHLQGTRYAIRVDRADGLLAQGAPGTALTWMDARVGGVPVTQRAGKAVEVNALWVNGLAGLATRWPGDGYQELHDRAKASFARRFVRPDGLLYDVVDSPTGDDPALRPNQLFAWSLPHAPLDADPAVLRRVADALLTPLGPRSLVPDDPAYRGAHRGGPADRDAAYHQGTVWPWLLGALWDACAGTNVLTSEIFAGILSHTDEYGLGSVSETADGDPPHAATGCPFQAWSVAEVLRCA